LSGLRSHLYRVVLAGDSAIKAADLQYKSASWFNHHRLLEAIGYIPPAEAEAMYYRNKEAQEQGQADTA
jgi:transposase InsO family protein